MSLKNEITEAHARMLLRTENIEDQIALWRKIVNENLSVRKLEEMTKVHKGKKRKKRFKIVFDDDPYLKKLEDKLRRFFGTKVKIKSRAKSKGEIIVEYYSNDDLERIIDKCEEN